MLLWNACALLTISCFLMRARPRNEWMSCVTATFAAGLASVWMQPHAQRMMAGQEVGAAKALVWLLAIIGLLCASQIWDDVRDGVWRRPGLNAD